MLDFYLSPEGLPHLPEIRRLALSNTTEADAIILQYAMEAIRLNGTFGSYRKCATTMTINDGEGRRVDVKSGDMVFCSFVSLTSSSPPFTTPSSSSSSSTNPCLCPPQVGAARDPVIFPDPDKVKTDRPLTSYLHYGSGPHACLGRDASQVALTAMLKTVAKLKNLRRAPGPKGQLKKIPRPGGFYIFMREDWGAFFPFPTSKSSLEYSEG